METIGIIVGIVAATVLVIYVWDRRTKQQPIDVMDAFKFVMGASGLAGGVAYAVSGSDDVAETITAAPEMVQEMFLGKPEF